jgi:hypothetical protein
VEVGLVVLDRQDVAPPRGDDRPRQRPLAEQGVAGQDPQPRVGGEQLVEVGLEHLRLGRLAAVADGPVGQAELQPLGEDVEDVDRAAVGAAGLLAGLAVDGGDQLGVGQQGRQPPGQGGAELGDGVARRAAPRRG